MREFRLLVTPSGKHERRRRVQAVLEHVPPVHGLPVRIYLSPSLTTRRGELLSGSPRGTAVYAGTFVRQRRIVIETDLLNHPSELARILVHELFHFVWLRLGNRTRWAYEALLESELRSRAQGELGWSAESRKIHLKRDQRVRRTRKWREYVCESFCDSAAWLFAGKKRHSEFTLAPPFRKQRKRWFQNSGLMQSISV